MTVSDPFYSQLSLLAPFDAADGSTTFTDASSFAHTFSTSGSPVISSTHSKAGNALYLNGSSSYLTVGSSSAFALGAGDFAMGVWLWPETQTSSYPVVFERTGSWGTGEWQLMAGHAEHPGVYSLYIYDQTVRDCLVGTVAVATGALQHVAIVRSGNVITLYVDGVADGSYTISGNFCGATSESFRIGNKFKGWIDCPSVTKGSNRGIVGNFTPDVAFYSEERQRVSFSETLNLSGALVGLARRTAGITDYLSLSGVVDATYKAGISSTLNLSASYGARRFLSGGITDTLALSGAVSGKATLRGSVSNTLNLSGYPSAIGRYKAGVTDALLLLDNGISTGGADSGLDVWVANIATQAHSRYAGFGFNSFCRYDGKYYGCKSDGIYELTGDTDGADPIPCTVTFAETDFGASNLKRFESVYLGVKASGQLVLKVVQDASNVYHYNVIPSGNDGRAARAVLGRGLTGRYWQLELASDTERFELDSIDYSFATLSRRI